MFPLAFFMQENPFIYLFTGKTFTQEGGFFLKSNYCPALVGKENTPVCALA